MNFSYENQIPTENSHIWSKKAKFPQNSHILVSPTRFPTFRAKIPQIVGIPTLVATLALTDGEALSRKPGLNEIFASLVPNLDHLICEVVKVEATRHTVNLYDVNKQNIAKLVLSMYNNMVPKVKALSPAPLPIPNI